MQDSVKNWFHSSLNFLEGFKANDIGNIKRSSEIFIVSLTLPEFPKLTKYIDFVKWVGPINFAASRRTKTQNVYLFSFFPYNQVISMFNNKRILSHTTFQLSLLLRYNCCYILVLVGLLNQLWVKWQIRMCSRVLGGSQLRRRTATYSE